MRVLPNDYDSDPGRFLSTERHWSVPDAVACLRVYGLAAAAAADAAATLDLPLALTKRGCVVYAAKAPQS